MRRYLGFRCQQFNPPQSAGKFTGTPCELSQFEDVVTVQGYAGTPARLASLGIDHGTDAESYDPTALVSWNGGSDKTLDGGDCTKPGDGELRVLYGDARLSSYKLNGTGRMTSVGGDLTARAAGFILGFLPDQYDETDAESISWAVPEQGIASTSIVGEVSRID